MARAQMVEVDPQTPGSTVQSSMVRDTVALPRRPAAAPGVRVVRVALAGCGVVGGELVRQLREGARELESRQGVRFELVRVLVRRPERPRAVELPAGLVTTDVAAFVGCNADLYVEAMGGLDPALRIARAALEAGRGFVTANKALVAAHGPELAALGRRHGGRLDFESAVAAGVPVIRALRDSLPASGVHSVRGILNGTTNFILTRLAEGQDFAAALAEAQARGFAEADPSRDLSGADAADKLAVLAWLALGVRPAELPVRRRGIHPGADTLALHASALGGVVKLVGEAVAVAGGVAAAVEPVVVPGDSELGRARDEQNVVLLESRWNGRLHLAGPGAGGAPTASALLGDMLRGACRIRPPAAGDARGVEDPRPLRWAVSVERGGERVLAEALAREAACVGCPVEGAGLALVVTPALPWRRLAPALAALERAGHRPVVSRCEVEV